MPEKVNELLTVMRHGSYLLVVDNFEDILARDNTVADPALRTFVELCVTKEHALRLLTTSRERIVVERANAAGTFRRT